MNRGGSPIEAEVIAFTKLPFIHLHFDAEECQRVSCGRPLVNGNEDIDIDVAGRSGLPVIANGQSTTESMGYPRLLQRMMKR